MSVSLRATEEQANLAEWLFRQLDRPPGETGQSAYLYPSAERGETAVRAFFLPQSQSPQQLQDIVNIIRGMAFVNDVLGVTDAKAIVMRGRPEQAALAEWLVGELAVSESAAHAPAVSAYEYVTQVEDRAGSVVRIYRLGGGVALDEIKRVINAARLQSGSNLMLPAGDAIVMRGNSQQVSATERVIEEWKARKGQGAR